MAHNAPKEPPGQMAFRSQQPVIAGSPETVFGPFRRPGQSVGNTSPLPPLWERGNSSRDVDSGSARLAKNNADSPTGSSRAFFKATTATNQWIAATEVTL